MGLPPTYVQETGQVQWLPPPMVRKNAEEIRALLIQHNFSAADKDGSGVISKAELSLMMYLALTLNCFHFFGGGEGKKECVPTC